MKNSNSNKNRDADVSTTAAQTTKTASEVERKPDGTITFQLTIPKARVSTAYKKAVSDAIKETEIKGFRKGKAPGKLVVEQVGKQRLYTDALKTLLPEVYGQAVNQLKISPITSPRVEPESLEEGKNWRLKVTVAERPKIDLGDYKKSVSAALASSKIWVPGKGEPTSAPSAPADKHGAQQQQSTDEKLSRVYDALISSISLTIPQFLIEEEVHRQLSQLVQQLERLNLTVDQYLVSLGKTSDNLREEYQAQAERTLKLELILNEVAQDLNVKVSDQEVTELIKAVGNEKLKEKLDTPTERATIRASLRKRKVLDQLLRM